MMKLMMMMMITTTDTDNDYILIKTKLSVHSTCRKLFLYVI